MTLPFVGLYLAYLLLKEQHFICTACHHSFTAETSVVSKHCYISKNIKTFIVIKTAEARSLTSIGKDCSISLTTVQREINEVSSSLQKYHSKLPEHLSFDEFKFAKVYRSFVFYRQ